eukprot:COSAG01_NODE_72773_length_252_cov_0.660131_1_plen_31_part_01
MLYARCALYEASSRLLVALLLSLFRLDLQVE